MTNFILVVFGHFAGDYWFQNKKMQLNKSKPGWLGHKWCTLHCVIYTATVCWFIKDFHLATIILVWLTHWPIDRWSLVDKWFQLIGGRTFKSAYLSQDRFRGYDMIFTGIVYATADSILHLYLLWLVMNNLDFFKNLF